jgi:hypothetical protein
MVRGRANNLAWGAGFYFEYKNPKLVTKKLFKNGIIIRKIISI